MSAQPKDDLATLRAALHRAADLLVDVIAERRQRAPRAKVIPVDDVSKAFARKAMLRLGWTK